MAHAKRAFTLIELLIVVAIIAILAAIAVPNFLEAQTRSRVSRVKADMRTVGNAVLLNYNDRGLNPIDFWDDDLTEARALGRETFNMPIFQNRRGGTCGVLVPLTTPIAYITSLPKDPFATGAGGNSTGITGPELVSNDQLPPHCYFYIDWDSKFEAPNSNPIYGLRPDEWLLHSVGPNARYDRVPVVFSTYDPTNGTISDGNITLHSRTGFESHASATP